MWIVRWMRSSYAPLRRSAGKAIRERQQHEDEGGKHGNRGEDAADEKIRGLLEQAEDQASNDRAAIVAHAAEGHRHEAIECEQRGVGKEREQQLPAGKSRKRTDDASERKARHAQVALRQAKRARRIVVFGDRQECV